MSNIVIRRCDLGWACCDGDCKDCKLAHISTSSRIGSYYEEVYGMITTTDCKTKWVGVYSGEHIG